MKPYASDNYYKDATMSRNERRGAYYAARKATRRVEKRSARFESKNNIKKELAN